MNVNSRYARYSAIVLMIGLWSFVSSCASPLLELSKGESGRIVEVERNSIVRVVLPGNITTGYSWSLQELSGKALRQTGEVAYATSAGTKGAVGRGGTFSFSFIAEQTGQSVIRCGYFRPWEKDTPPLETYCVTVTVVRAAADTVKRSQSETKTNQANYVAGKVLVGFKNGVSAEQRRKAVASIPGAKIEKEMVKGSIVLVTLPPDVTVPDGIKQLSARKEVRYAEPDRIITLDQIEREETGNDVD